MSKADTKLSLKSPEPVVAPKPEAGLGLRALGAAKKEEEKQKEQFDEFEECLKQIDGKLFYCKNRYRI